MELQHVDITLQLHADNGLDLSEVVPIFHNWIQEQESDEVLIDVADYRHVFDGPGVVLIGKDGDYSVGTARGRLGLRYYRKSPLEGSNSDRLGQAFSSALKACQRLQLADGLTHQVQFEGRHLQVVANDRLLTPNSETTYQQLQPELERFFERVAVNNAVALSPEQDRRRLFGFDVEWKTPLRIDEVLQRLEEL